MTECRLKGSSLSAIVYTLILENVEHVEEVICSHESVLHVYKRRYEIGMEMSILRSSVRCIAQQFGWKFEHYGFCHSRWCHIVFRSSF